VLETAFSEGFEDDVFSDPPIRQETFENVQQMLQRVYADEAAPKEVRRRALEASVRAPQDWHADAIRTAYASGDEEWRLTAVFGMRWIRGFDTEIMEALGSPNAEIHSEAVQAAGAFEVSAAWGHIEKLVTTPGTDKDLLLAAIEAASGVNPGETRDLLSPLMYSEDEDIAAAVDESLMMADGRLALDADEEDMDEEEEEEEEKSEGG
jgi:hypothetical protein